MALDFTYEFLSGGAGDGTGILVVATATPGTLIHTGHATAKDEIYIKAQNNHTAEVTLTIEFGGVTSPDDLIIIPIPSKQGLFEVVDGLPLTNLVVRAFASVANVVTLFGRVYRGTTT